MMVVALRLRLQVVAVVSPTKIGYIASQLVRRPTAYRAFLPGETDAGRC